MIISGGDNGVLTAYSRVGKKLGDFTGHNDEVWAVTPSPDGRYLVSGAHDQTVRLWNLKSRELLATLFYGRDGEWVMWTPQGYYDASGPGAEMIGWQINHSPDQAPDYVTGAQLRKSLHRPDIIARAIQLASAEAAVKEAYGTHFKLSDLLAKPVPRFRIVSPAANATFSGGGTEVEIALEPTPDPVKLIRVQVNGREIAEQVPHQGGGFTPGILKIPVPLAKGRNAIHLVAVNESGETPADLVVTHPGDGDLDRRGTLYILAIGVDKYPNIPGHDLRSGPTHNRRQGAKPHRPAHRPRWQSIEGLHEATSLTHQAEGSIQFEQVVQRKLNETVARLLCARCPGPVVSRRRRLKCSQAEPAARSPGFGLAR